MKKVILWFFLCCKRYLKRIPFLLLLAALPLTALAASRMENGKDGTVRIAVFSFRSMRLTSPFICRTTRFLTRITPFLSTYKRPSSEE